MAVTKNVTLTKRDQSVPIFQLVKGDRATSGVTLNISRYDGGVDLSTLGWSIKIENANGDTDIVMFAPTVSDMWLMYDWEFPTICAAKEGITTFELEAVNADGGRVWQSGKRCISVIEGLDATPGYSSQQLSIFQQTVSLVNVKVAAMGDTVDGLETRINTAVSSAEAATAQANQSAASAASAVASAQQATTSATQAVTNANAAIANANTATSAANTAATAANTAASNAQNTANSLLQRAAAGEFTGPQGPQGPRGPQGPIGLQGNDYVLTDLDKQEIADIASVTAASEAATLVQPTITQLSNSVNGKANSSDLTAHTGNSGIHVTQDDKDKWDGYGSLGDDITAIYGELDGKANASDIPPSIVQDVKINGTSILSDGVANVPVATNTAVGLIKGGAFGAKISNSALYPEPVSLATYSSWSSYNFIARGTLENIKEDYVKRALKSDAMSLDDNEKSAVCDTIGAATQTSFTSVITLLGQVKTALEGGNTQQAVNLLDTFIIGQGVLSE